MVTMKYSMYVCIACYYLLKVFILYSLYFYFMFILFNILLFIKEVNKILFLGKMDYGPII